VNMYASQLKAGIKMWSTNSPILNGAADLIDDKIFHYIELTPIPGTSISTFASFDLPYVIHITTERHGMIISDPDKKEFNHRIISECIEWADILNAEYLILHPGTDNMQNAIEFLRNIEDERILIENMPKMGIGGQLMNGYLPEQIIEIQRGKFGFCLDLNHAIKAAISVGCDYKKLINDFLKLNPSMFHISDGRMDYEMDEHMHLGDGEYDIGYLRQCILSSRSRLVTLETPRDNNTFFEDDIRNLKILSGITY